MVVIVTVFVMPVAMIVIALAALGVLEVPAGLVLEPDDAVHAGVGSRLDGTSHGVSPQVTSSF